MRHVKLPQVIMRENAVQKIPDLLKSIDDFKSILSIVGRTTHELVGKKISEMLTNEGYGTSFFFAETPDQSTLDRAIEKGRESDLVIGIGGGKNIDIAKATAHHLKVPCITVPTIPSHDGIASNRSVISRGERKYPVVGELPIAVVADTEVLSKAPLRYFSAGCGDVISHITSVLDWRLARDEKGEDYDEFTASLVSSTAGLIINLSKDYEKDFKSSVELLIQALITCGITMYLTNSSRPCSGAEHMFCHTLDKMFPENKALHGEKVALGAFIMSLLHGINYEEIREALVSYKLPVTHEDIGIPSDILVKALSETHTIRSDNRYTILKDGIKEDEAREILKKLEII